MDFSTYIIPGMVGLSILLCLVIVFCFYHINKLKKQLNQAMNDKERLEKRLRLEKSKSGIKRNEPKVSPKSINPISAHSGSEIQKQEQKDEVSAMEKIESNQREEDGLDSKLSVTHRYAEPFNVTEQTFYAVTNAPTEGTIYELTSSSDMPNEAYLDLYTGACEKVLGCMDFLEGCCEVIGSGDRIEVEERGVVAFEENVWRVKRDLKIKLY